MLELGVWSRGEHLKILRQALSGRADVWLVGPHFADAFAALEPSAERPPVRLFATRAELEAELSRRPVVNALVLLKGSHGIGLEHCIGRF